MIKETRESLRLYFIFLSVAYFLMFAGSVANVVLLLRDKPEAHLSLLFLAKTLFTLLVCLAFVFTVAKYKSLIKEAPTKIKGILHVYFWGSIAFALIYWGSGSSPNIVGGIIQVLIYVYLLKSVERLSKEPVIVENLSNT